jgi:hypothetical protein
MSSLTPASGRDNGPETALSGAEIARAAVPPHRPKAASTVSFAPGVALAREGARLTTLALVLLEVSPAVRQAAYEYAYGLQRLTQRVRIVVVSDGADLKEIRRYGWMVEHILSRSDLSALEPEKDWAEMAAARLRRLSERLDVAYLLVADEQGIDRIDHERLCRAIKAKVPFQAIAPAPQL